MHFLNYRKFVKSLMIYACVYRYQLGNTCVYLILIFNTFFSTYLLMVVYDDVQCIYYGKNR